jgi:hypothetical protein
MSPPSEYPAYLNDRPGIVYPCRLAAFKSGIFISEESYLTEILDRQIPARPNEQSQCYFLDFIAIKDRDSNALSIQNNSDIRKVEGTSMPANVGKFGPVLAKHNDEIGFAFSYLGKTFLKFFLSSAYLSELVVIPFILFFF